jgi:glutathione S-transferase
MSLTLYYHPLSSYCQKVLVALYEAGAPFAPHLVDLGDPAQAAALRTHWPLGKFPVLRDDARDRTVPESSVIIEYLARHYPGGSALVPTHEGAARAVRACDRFFDLHVMTPMQQIVADRIRPDGEKFPRSVIEARAALEAAYGVVERAISGRTWATGEAFTMADCAAAPSLAHADRVAPLGERFPLTRRYLERLRARPSFARAEREATPYFHMFPAG